MARFREDTGTWIDLVEGQPEKGSICLKELTIEEIEEIDKITIRTKKKAVRGIPYDQEKINRPLARKLRMKKAIVDWKGIYLDDDAEEAECNDDNRVKIMKSLDFLKILTKLLEDLFETNKALEDDEPDLAKNEDQVKNS